jgi:hypothetical protein
MNQKDIKKCVVTVVANASCYGPFVFLGLFLLQLW